MVLIGNVRHLKKLAAEHGKITVMDLIKKLRLKNLH